MKKSSFSPLPGHEDTAPTEEQGSFFARLLALLRQDETGTAAARRQIYAGFEADYMDMLKLRGLTAAEREAEGRQLRQSIRLLEKDVRAGVDVWRPEYRPGGYVVAAKSYAYTAPAGADAAAQIPLPEEEAAAAQDAASVFDEPLQTGASHEETAARLHNALLYLQPHARHRRPGVFAVLRALLIYQFDLMSGESRVAILWMMIQPAVLLALVSSMYFIVGTHQILNMDIPTFALLGAGTWIMCRQIIFRVSNQIAHQRVMMNMPRVTPALQGVTQGLLYLMIYTFSIGLLIALGRVVDLSAMGIGPTALPDNPLKVAMYAAGIWLFSVSTGFFFGGIAVFWPYFLRFAPIIERALQIFSSVFFVSEQLPEAYKFLFLWSPLAHGFQLMRGAYYDSYPSVDASAAYFWVSVSIYAFAGFFVERFVRRHAPPIQ